jgi:Zn-dependent protease with chaperone function
MAIEKLEHLEPRAFLDKVLETPYPWEEKALDIAGFIGAMLGEMVWGSLQHPFNTLHLTYRLLFPDLNEFQNQRLLTIDNIEKIISNKNEALKAKLLFIATTTERLAKKMGLTDVTVVLADRKGYEGAGKGVVKKTMILPTEAVDWSHEKIAFVIAHELSHFQHKDLLKDGIFSWVILAVQLLAFRHFGALRAFSIGVVIQTLAKFVVQAMALDQEKTSPLKKSVFGLTTLILQLLAFRYFGALRVYGVGMLMAGIVHFIKSTIEIDQERAADANALQCLNSNTGMIQYVCASLRPAFTIKHTSAEELQKMIPTLDVEEIESMQDGITPHGNVRDAWTHPPRTERLAFALNFKPTA